MPRTPTTIIRDDKPRGGETRTRSTLTAAQQRPRHVGRITTEFAEVGVHGQHRQRDLTLSLLSKVHYAASDLYTKHVAYRMYTAHNKMASAGTEELAERGDLVIIHDMLSAKGLCVYNDTVGDRCTAVRELRRRSVCGFGARERPLLGALKGSRRETGQCGGSGREV